jgi:K+-transporting ATPase ATPase C chain
MKSIAVAVRLTFFCLLFFSLLYPLAVTGLAQWAPNAGRGEQVMHNGRVAGFVRVGQSFTQASYFWGRPSAVQYNAAGSGGSNKGPNNPDYLAEVAARIDTFMAYHPYLKREETPAEMVTASGSGLDPHLSPQAALVQVRRVAEARNLPEEQVRALVVSHVQSPLLGVFGPACVNVLALNLALDAL